jgi:hypothetical protein
LIHFETRLVEEIVAQKQATCPHCNREEQLDVRELKGTLMALLPLPTGRACVCPNCQGVSRRESRATRIFSGLFLVPFATVLAVGFFVGLWMIDSSLLEGIFDPTLLGMAAVLVGVAGYLGYRVIRSIRVLLTERQLLPLNSALQTQL